MSRFQLLEHFDQVYRSTQCSLLVVLVVKVVLVLGGGYCVGVLRGCVVGVYCQGILPNIVNVGGISSQT